MSVEIDEQWSYVQNKKQQRWLWYALEQSSKRILAYVFGKREDSCLVELLKKLSCFSIKTFFTDNWGSYRRLIPKEKHVIGKQFTQSIERYNLNLRTHIKRLTRRTICFSKSSQMHDRIIVTTQPRLKSAIFARKMPEI